VGLSGLDFRKVALSFRGRTINSTMHGGRELGSTMHRVPPKFLARLARLAVVCLMVVFARTAYAQVPNINIQDTCRAAAGVMVNLMGGSTSQNDVQICLETENKARQQLLKDWSTFTASDREGCIQANVYLPSYVEWLTCFEMNKSVREARQQGRAMNEIVNPDGSVTLPLVSSLGIMGGTGPRRSYAQSKYNAPKPIQGTIQSAAVKAAEAEWNKLPTNQLACANQKLTARGDSVPSLARRGVLPSDTRVADTVAQCLSPSSPVSSSSPGTPPVSSSSPAISPVVAQAAQQPQQQGSSEERTIELKQTIDKLQSDLAASNARVAALEKGKVAAESAVKQAQQARSDTEKAQNETHNARNADQAKLEEVTAQFEAYKASTDAKLDWRWAYVGIAGLIGLIAGFTAFPFIRRKYPAI
jgi:ElaB/YqjD/DUF883 family membrane-anchored ribosome-binding protein